MTRDELLISAVEMMIECAQEPGEWIVGRNAYYELRALDCFVQGAPPTIYGIPIVYDEFAKPDTIYLMSQRDAEICSLSMGRGILHKRKKPPKQKRKRKKEWWE